ncbi:MAG TPA: hypothetical protein PLK77_05670 [Pyrinomonadaceae bacterium]|nr:hypothetical protein [Pyrinomonadaceae bacterium]
MRFVAGRSKVGGVGAVGDSVGARRSGSEQASGGVGGGMSASEWPGGVGVAGARMNGTTEGGVMKSET